jgi:hypothetical protein
MSHTLKISYRPDNYPEWLPWREFSQEFTLIGKAGALGVGAVPSANAGFSPRTSFGKPQNSTDVLETGRNLRRGFDFQVRFQGTGHMVLDRFRLHAQRLIERSRARQ